MEDNNQSISGNDYAVAKALNGIVTRIFLLVLIANAVGLPEDQEIDELNRAYILLTNELQRLYYRNPELAAIKPEPVWKLFDVLKTSSWEIQDYVEANDEFGKAHTVRVERLCILAGKETPDYSPEQKELIEFSKTITAKYSKMLDKVNAESRAKKENDWHIPEYKLTYRLDGTILINDVLKLKKIHTGSTTERLLEQALKNPNTLFRPDLGQTSRNISTVLNSAGFTATLRQLFFPTVSATKGVVFRNSVTRAQADSDNIDTKELDLTLKDLGATTEPKFAN